MGITRIDGDEVRFDLLRRIVKLFIDLSRVKQLGGNDIERRAIATKL